MSVAEYGVYKGSAGSNVKPVSSARGPLMLSLLMTIFFGISAVSLAIVWIQDGFGAVAGILFPLLLAAAFTLWGWVYFARERRAEKLRKARGLTLIRPE